MDPQQELLESGMLVTSLTTSNRGGPRVARPKNESSRSLPAIDVVQQIHRWRQKASLYTQMAVRSPLALSSPIPFCMLHEDYFGLALTLLSRALECCRSMGAPLDEMRSVCEDAASVLRLRGDSVGALVMGSRARSREAVEWAVAELNQGCGGREEEAAEAALEAAEWSEGARLLLQRLSQHGGICADRWLQWVAREAAMEKEEERRKIAVQALMEEGKKLKRDVGKLVEQCGDTTLEIRREGAEKDETPIIIAIARAALSGASPYFYKLLDGGFAETGQNKVVIEVPFPEAMVDAIRWMYGDELFIPDPARAIELLSLAARLQIDDLRQIACDFLGDCLNRVELDGETVAFVLMQHLPPAFESQLLRQWMNGICSLAKESILVEDLERAIGTSDWDLSLREGFSDQAFHAFANKGNLLAVILRRLGAGISQGTLVDQIRRFGSHFPENLQEPFAALIKPAHFMAISGFKWCYREQALKKLVAPLEEIPLVSNWFEHCDAEQLVVMMHFCQELGLCVVLNNWVGLCKAVLKVAPGLFHEAFQLFPTPPAPTPILTDLLLCAIDARAVEAVMMLAELQQMDLKAPLNAGDVTVTVVLTGQGRKWQRGNTRGSGALPAVAPAGDDLDQLMEELAQERSTCGQCRVVDGHLTTCPNFRKAQGRYDSRRAPVVAPAQKLTWRAQYMLILSDEAFPILQYPRSVASHAMLKGLPEEVIFKLLDLGSPAETKGQVFSAVEIGAWRGVSEELMTRMLTQPLEPNNVIGLTAFHIALLRSQAHLLDMLNEKFLKDPYSIRTSTGHTPNVVLQAFVKSHTISDAAKEKCNRILVKRSGLQLDEEGAGLAMRNLERLISRGNESNANDNNTSSNNNNNNNAPIADNNNNNNNNNNNDDDDGEWEDPAAFGYLENVQQQIGAPDAAEILASGALEKIVRTARILWKYTQVRQCVVLRHADGTMILQESAPDMSSRGSITIKNVAFDGMLMIVTAQDDSKSTYRLNHRNQGTWRPLQHAVFNQ